MEMNKFKTTSLFLFTLLLASCGGGGGDGSDSPTDTGNPDTTTDKTIVKLDVSEVPITDLSQYKLSSKHGEVDADGDKQVVLNKDEKDIVSLVDDFGTPFLMGRKYIGDTEAEVSLDSTAEMLVLSTAKFSGTEITNTKELSKRIRDHSSFERLKQRVSRKIESGSVCPLSFSCNLRAADLAVEIANDTNIEDL